MANRSKPANKKSKGLGFDLSKPIKQGVLLKQGALHRAFKHRFFVLYPGFLVYYDDQSKWRLDVTRGDTLQSRQGAVKLKNCSASVAKHAPKGCRYGIIVHAPDPSNKRPTYLVNATSKEDRDMWIEAIRQGTPHSPQPARKDPPKATPPKEEPADRPTYTQRQETVDLAAKVASEAASQNVEDSVTSIDASLTEEPSMSVRRDTSSSAALSITSGDKDPATMDSVCEEEDPIVSIDCALGPADDDNASEADLLDQPDLNDLEEELNNESPSHERTASDESPSHEGVVTDESPSHEVMASDETVSEGTNSSGDKEIITTIAVVCNTENSDVAGNKRGEEAAESDVPVNQNGVIQNGLSTEDKPCPLENAASDQLSTEVIIPASEERHNSFTINSSDPDGESDTDNEDGDGSSLASLGLTDSPTSATPPTPSTPAITLLRAMSEEETIEVKEVEKHSESNGVVANGVVANGVVANGDGPKLSPPAPRKNETRRPSAAFIQKVGYLYKLGGQRKNWKLRYFVLNPGVFFYYKSPKSTKPLGEVKLKNSKVYFPTAGERKTSYQFAIHTESQWNKRSEWVIAAQSDREMKEWIDAFKAAGHKSTPTPSPSGSPTGSDGEN